MFQRMSPRLILFWRVRGDGLPQHDRLPDIDNGDEDEDVQFQDVRDQDVREDNNIELEEMAGEAGEGLESADEGEVLRAVLLRLAGLAGGAPEPLVPTPPLHRAAGLLRQRATVLADTLACRAERTAAGPRLRVAFQSACDGAVAAAPAAFVAVAGDAAPAGLALCKTACRVASAPGAPGPRVCEHEATVPLARDPVEGVVLTLRLRIPSSAAGEEDKDKDEDEGDKEEDNEEVFVVSEKTVVAVHGKSKSEGKGEGEDEDDDILETRVLKRTLRTSDGRRLASRECFRSERCLICYDEGRADTVALPCRHLCVCRDCAEPLRHDTPLCPVCRTPVVAFVTVPGLDDSSDREDDGEEEKEDEAVPEIPGHGRVNSVRRFLIERAGAGTRVALPPRNEGTAPRGTTTTTTTTTTEQRTP